MENLSRPPSRQEHQCSRVVRAAKNRRDGNTIPICRPFECSACLFVIQNRSFGIGGKRSRNNRRASIYTVTSKIWCGMHPNTPAEHGAGRDLWCSRDFGNHGSDHVRTDSQPENEKFLQTPHYLTRHFAMERWVGVKQSHTGGGRRSAGTSSVTSCNEVSTW